MNDNVALSEEQIILLDKEREKYMNGDGRSYSWEEAKEIIRNKMRKCTSLRSKTSHTNNDTLS